MTFTWATIGMIAAGIVVWALGAVLLNTQLSKVLSNTPVGLVLFVWTAIVSVTVTLMST